jgi:hypothetical protein
MKLTTHLNLVSRLKMRAAILQDVALNESQDGTGWSRSNVLGLHTGDVLFEFGQAPTALIEAFCSFHQALQANAGIIPRSENGRFLPNPF